MLAPRREKLRGYIFRWFFISDWLFILGSYMLCYYAYCFSYLSGLGMKVIIGLLTEELFDFAVEFIIYWA